MYPRRMHRLKEATVILFLKLVTPAFCIYSLNITCKQGLPSYLPIKSEVFRKINETIESNSIVMALEKEMNNSALCKAAKEMALKVVPTEAKRFRRENDFRNLKDKHSRGNILSNRSSTTSTNSTMLSIKSNWSTVDKNANETSRRGDPFTLPLDIIPDRPGPGVPPTIVFSYTLQLLAEKTLQKRQKYCATSGGEYDHVLGICKLKTSENVTVYALKNDSLTNPVITYIIIIVGNGLSVLCLLLLLAVYALIRSLQTRSGKNIMCLSLTITIAQSLQLIAVHITEMKTACTVIGIVLHWAYLTTFLWMTVISYDLLLTFGFPFKNFRIGNDRLFRSYIKVAFTIPTIIVTICSAIHLINKNVIGYGIRVCFIGDLWANLFTYVLFVVIVMVINCVGLVTTIVEIYKSRKSVEGCQSSRKISSRHRFQLTFMALKVSTLTSLGWIFGAIGAFLGNSALTYIFFVLTAFQGVFVFIAFCCNKRVYALLATYRRNRSLNRTIKEVGTPMSTLQNTYETPLDRKHSCTISSISGTRAANCE